MYSTKSPDKQFDYQSASRYCSKCGSVVGSEDVFCASCGAELTVRKTGSYVAESSRLSSFRGYIQILGVVEIVFGVFALIIGLLLTCCVPLLFYVLRSDFIEFETENPEILSRIAPFLSVVLFGIALICLIYAFVSIISGKRLLQYENSGRIGTMVIAALNLFNFPFGTIFGLAALYILSQSEVEQLYTK
ncbi:MAG: zinc ribbon domain-containing protein [Candidatus Hodarchaeota archaeon]